MNPESKNYNNNKSKIGYDKNHNMILDIEEWYAWRTDTVIYQKVIDDTLSRYNNRGSNQCPVESFTSDKAKMLRQCLN